MPYLYLAYYFALAATFVASLALASLLWFKAGQRRGIAPLVWFCLGTGLWAAGLLLIHLGDLATARAGQAVVNLTPPLVAACLVHFALVFTEAAQSARLLAAIYVVASAVAAVAVFLGAGRLEPWLAFPRFYLLDRAAWIAGGVAVALSVGGQLLIAHGAWKSRHTTKRRQLLAVLLATVGGLGSASGLLFATFGFSWFPVPMLLLPGYTLILVYGVLRYEFMEVNLWARRSLAAALLVAGLLIVVSAFVTVLAFLGFTQVAGLPWWQIWMFTLAVLIIAGALQKPVTALATKLIYPGSRLDAAILEEWRTLLEKVQSWEEFRTRAGGLLGRHLQQPVEVRLGGNDAPLDERTLRVRCARGPSGWTADLIGWESATPGVRQTGAIFCAILAGAANRLEQALRIAEHEKKVLEQAHLADLGRLSATVAHELRNPLNIIGMASTKCPPDVKWGILDQVHRADRLTQDLLTYTGKLTVEKKAVPLRELVDTVVAPYRLGSISLQVEIPRDLTVSADAHRMQQVLVNLLDNARNALEGQPDSQIGISADRENDQVCVAVCDNGPGIPAAVQQDLFRAFVSGRPGGHGLGLALVRRIMEAHGGRVELAARQGWSCCVELKFPLERKA